MAGSSDPKSFTHLELCLVMKRSEASFSDHKKQLTVLKDFILSTFGLKDKTALQEEEELEKCLRLFLARVISLYKKESHKYDLFTSKNSSFLEKVFQLPGFIKEFVKASADDSSPVKPSSTKRPQVGRKPVPFNEKSVRAQQYASAKVREHHEPGAIVLAAAQQPSTLGQLVKKTKSPSGQTAGLALKAIKSPRRPGIGYSFEFYVVS